VWWFIFVEKDVFLFQPPTRFGRGIEEPKGLVVQKILKSTAFSRRNRDLTDPTVIKPIGTVICLKCEEKFQYSCSIVL
jgi:hypothetical protein